MDQCGTTRVNRWVSCAAWGLAVALGPVAAAGQELPPDIQLDLYLVRADRHVQNEDWAAAMEALDIVFLLQADQGMETPAELWFTHARAALEAGYPHIAITSATRYLQEAGREGQDYGSALVLLDEARERAEGEATPTPAPTPMPTPASTPTALSGGEVEGLQPSELGQESSSSKPEIGVLVGFTKVSGDGVDLTVIALPGSVLAFGGPLYTSIPLSERISIRAEVSVTSVNSEGESLSVFGSGVYGSVFLLGGSEGPYLLGGGSALAVQIDGDNETEFSLGAGFGLLARAGAGLVFRAEARYARYLEDPTDAFQLLIGFGAPIG